MRANEAPGEGSGMPRLLLVTRFGISVRDVGWLQHRLELFSAITAPSILNQTDGHLTWAITVEDELPRRIRRRLERVIAPFDDAHLVRHERYGYGTPGFMALARDLGTAGADGWVLTSRLDDDDAWDRRTVERVYDVARAWMSQNSATAPGLGITFDKVLVWVMYEMLSLRKLAKGRIAVQPPVMRETIDPFLGTSVFVLSRLGSGVSARSAGHYQMASFLTERGYDVEVIRTEEPASLYCRHKQTNTAVGKWRDDALPVDHGIDDLARIFGIDEARTRHYLDGAAQLPYALENRPNHRRRERNRELARIQSELAAAPDARAAAVLRARRRLLLVEAEDSNAAKVADFPELVAARGKRRTPMARGEQIAELRGILAERQRGRAEVRRIVEQAELELIRAERRATRGGVRTVAQRGGTGATPDGTGAGAWVAFVRGRLDTSLGRRLQGSRLVEMLPARLHELEQRLRREGGREAGRWVVSRSRARLRRRRP